MKRVFRIFIFTVFALFAGICYGQDRAGTPVIHAEYPGGNVALMKYITSNIHATSRADNGLPVGKVVAKFFVEADGRTSEARIIKTSQHPKIDKDVIDAIKAMPKWKPAEKPKGQKVRQEITLPIFICGA